MSDYDVIDGRDCAVEVASASELNSWGVCRNYNSTLPTWSTAAFVSPCNVAHRNKHEATGEVTSTPHRNGYVLYLPHPMNQAHLHSVPKRKRVASCRISLTFREIVEK